MKITTRFQGEILTTEIPFSDQFPKLKIPCEHYCHGCNRTYDCGQGNECARAKKTKDCDYCEGKD